MYDGHEPFQTVKATMAVQRAINWEFRPKGMKYKQKKQVCEVKAAESLSCQIFEFLIVTLSAIYLT